MPGALGKLFETIRREPSTSYDQLTDAEAAGATKAVKQTTLLHDLTHLTPKNVMTMAQALATLSSGEPMDDRDLLLEHGVSMLQTLPPNSGMGAGIAGSLIGVLWRDLPHPPGTICGPTATFRSGDGSGNCPWDPEMGKAGSPYSRSVPPLKPKPLNLPDPELVYDQLMRRRPGQFKEHPSGLNRMFFSFATVVIHECFQSSHTKPWINETSSYVDLSVIYGNTQADQDRVRTFENGLLYPDTIASERIMLMPPGVVAICICFARFHNHVAKRLLEINEKGMYKSTEEASVEELKAQDEEIFQYARNITVAHFASTVLRDYVSAILNTVRANSEWHLDLGGEIRQMGGTRLERGAGNVVSAEFNVLYHWHAPLSHSDDLWMAGVLNRAFPDKEMDQITAYEMWEYLMKRGEYFKETPPNEWTYGQFKRNSEGYFDDAQLAKLIKDLIDEPAHAFGARGTPASLRLVDINGMMMARKHFNVCTLNEFRKYLHLREYQSFREWNPDPEIAAAAERLYGHIDNLELYPGLMAEETKPAMPGSGVCPGHTTGRGILDDAVALVRGDRFLTFDFNSSTLTNWGLAQLQGSPGAYGGILSKVLFTALPNAWKGTSPYVLLPFYTPKAIAQILKDNGVVNDYDLSRPPDDNSLKAIQTYDGCKRAFEDRNILPVNYHERICALSDNAHFLLCSDDPTWHDVRARILKDAFYTDDFELKVRSYFNKVVPSLIGQRSLAFSTSNRRQIDIVRDVCNVAPIMWIAERFAIPLKTQEHPRGLISVPELFGALLVVFIWTSFDVVPHASWKLREAARQVTPMLVNLLKGQIRTQLGPMEPIVDWLSRGTAYECGPEAERMFEQMKNKLSAEVIAYQCLHLITATAGNMTQQASLLIDLYLQDKYEKERKRIIELANSSEAAADDELVGFVMEGMRLAGVVPGLPRKAARSFTFRDGSRNVPIKEGDTVLIAISRASMDPEAFPDPETIDPKRPRDKYLLLGWGLHFCFGARLVGPCLASILKQVFKLRNIRRAPGKAGELTSFYDEVAPGVPARLYMDRNCGESPIPTSLVIEYDYDVSMTAIDEKTGQPSLYYP